jgi:hypothetical protein
MRASDRAIIPPTPVPCIHLPTSITVKFFEIPQRIAPSVKRKSATRRSALRPKRSDRERKFGWQTVEARRNDVPVQRASIAVP